MKIRTNKQKQIEIQLEPKQKYSLLFHRLNKGKYEQYIKRGNEIVVLTKEQLQEIKKYIESMEV